MENNVNANVTANNTNNNANNNANNEQIVTLEQLEEAEERLKLFNKKAVRMGFAPFVIERIGEPFSEPFKAEVFQRIRSVSSWKICYDGWSFKGSFYNSNGVNVLTPNLPEKYRFAESRCDHCGRNHLQTLYVVQHEDGEEKVLGSTCLKSYTGIEGSSLIPVLKDFEDIVRYVDDDDDDDGFERRKWSKYIASDFVIAAAIKALNDIDCPPGKSPNKEFFKDRAFMNVTGRLDEVPENAWLETKKIEEFFQNGEFEDSFSRNIKALTGGYIERRGIGTLIWAPVVYYREQSRRRREQENFDNSEWVGKVGERIEFSVNGLRCVFQTHFAVGWNSVAATYIYKFNTDEGNVVILRSSKELTRLDSIKRIKATITKQDTRDGVKQTTVNRAKIL